MSKLASVVDWLPVSGFGASVPFRLPAAGAPDWQATLAEIRVVGADYFQTMGIPVVAGRPFDRRDVDGAPPVVAINESLARAYFGSESPIGRRLTLDRGGPLEVEIVGVVGDVRELALRLPPAPGLYAPKAQQPWMRHEPAIPSSARADPRSLAPMLQAVLRELERDMPLAPIQRMDEVVDGALARPGFYASAVAGFAAHGGAAGGVRHLRDGHVGGGPAPSRARCASALGASRRDVLMRAAGLGRHADTDRRRGGVPLALAAGRILRDQLYGIARPTVDHRSRGRGHGGRRTRRGHRAGRPGDAARSRRRAQARSRRLSQRPTSSAEPGDAARNSGDIPGS